MTYHKAQAQEYQTKFMDKTSHLNDKTEENSFLNHSEALI